jgi:hypothetical protein
MGEKETMGKEGEDTWLSPVVPHHLLVAATSVDALPPQPPPVHRGEGTAAASLVQLRSRVGQAVMEWGSGDGCGMRLQSG